MQHLRSILTMHCSPRLSLALLWLMMLVPCLIARPGFAQLNQPWWQRAPQKNSRFYQIKTDLPRETARGYARHLDAMYLEYARRLASLPPRAPDTLNVLIFNHLEDYLYTLRVRWGINATGTGGMFIVRAKEQALAFWVQHDGVKLPERRIQHVMQHEGFHQFAYSRFGGDLPVWVNEGLAEFFGQSIMINSKLMLGQAGRRILDEIKNDIELDRIIAFNKMLTMTGEQWQEALGTGGARGQYNQAWSMVHFLIYADPDGDGRPDYVDAFEDYLRLLNNAVPSQTAFKQIFGDDIDAFQRRWRDWAVNATPTAFISALEQIEFLAQGVLELNRRSTYPQSLAELKAALVAIDFTYSIIKHGTQIELRATDDSLFVIPAVDSNLPPPEFEVSKSRLYGIKLRERKLEETNPTPPQIQTRSLRPRNLFIRWVRNFDTNTFSYEIDVR